MAGCIIIKLFNDSYFYLFSANCVAEETDLGVSSNVSVSSPCRLRHLLIQDHILVQHLHAKCGWFVRTAIEPSLV
jgi:hypothetical protein